MLNSPIQLLLFFVICKSKILNLRTVFSSQTQLCSMLFVSQKSSAYKFYSAVKFSCCYFCDLSVRNPQSTICVQQSDSAIAIYMLLFVSQKSPVHKLCSAVRLNHCYIYVVVCKPEIPSPQAVLSSQTQPLL